MLISCKVLVVRTLLCVLCRPKISSCEIMERTPAHRPFKTCLSAGSNAIKPKSKTETINRPIWCKLHRNGFSYTGSPLDFRKQVGFVRLWESLKPEEWGDWRYPWEQVLCNLYPPHNTSNHQTAPLTLTLDMLQRNNSFSQMCCVVSTESTKKKRKNETPSFLFY